MTFNVEQNKYSYISNLTIINGNKNKKTNNDHNKGIIIEQKSSPKEMDTKRGINVDQYRLNRANENILNLTI